MLVGYRSKTLSGIRADGQQKQSCSIAVTMITAESAKVLHAGIMQRVIDEAKYVLRVLHRMEDEVSANPESFDPDARVRIEEAIDRVDDVLRHAELMVSGSAHSPKAA